MKRFTLIEIVQNMLETFRLCSTTCFVLFRRLLDLENEESLLYQRKGVLVGLLPSVIKALMIGSLFRTQFCFRLGCISKKA